MLPAQLGMKWSWQRHIKLLTGLVMLNINHLLTPSNNPGAARWKGIPTPLEQGNAFIHFFVVKVPAQLARGTAMLWCL